LNPGGGRTSTKAIQSEWLWWHLRHYDRVGEQRYLTPEKQHNDERSHRWCQNDEHHFRSPVDSLVRRGRDRRVAHAVGMAGGF
jgi:hypothetical protein